MDERTNDRQTTNDIKKIDSNYIQCNASVIRHLDSKRFACSRLLRNCRSLSLLLLYRECQKNKLGAKKEKQISRIILRFVGRLRFASRRLQQRAETVINAENTETTSLKIRTCAHHLSLKTLRMHRTYQKRVTTKPIDKRVLLFASTNVASCFFAV